MQTQIHWQRPNKHHLIHRPGLVKKQFKVKEIEPGNVLRWEDDGGQIAGDEATTIAQPLLPAQGPMDKRPR